MSLIGMLRQMRPGGDGPMLGFPELPRSPLFPGLALLQDKVYRPANQFLGRIMPGVMGSPDKPRKPPERGDFEDRMMR